MCSGSKAKLREAGLGIVGLPACVVTRPRPLHTFTACRMQTCDRHEKLNAPGRPRNRPTGARSAVAAAHGRATIDRESWPRSAVGVGGTLDRGRAPFGGASTAYARLDRKGRR